MDKFVIGAMIGPVRFATAYEKYGQVLSLAKVIVLRPELFYAYTGQPLSESEREMLNEMARAKIDLAEFVFVVNSGGYIGNDTKDEIYYAVSKRKPLVFATPLSGEAGASIRELVEQNWGKDYTVINHEATDSAGNVFTGVSGIMPQEYDYTQRALSWLDIMGNI